MILLKEVTKDFGEERGVFGLNMELKPGKIYGFLGKNGAGKTTTLKLLMGLLQPDEGEIYIDQKDINNYNNQPIIKKILGYMPAEEYLQTDLTGKENLEYMSFLKTGKLDSYQALEKEIKLMEMDDYLDEPLSSYSSGMKRKIHLLASLIGNPKILLWDEPHAGLDVISNIHMHEILKEWMAPDRLVFFSSHILEMVESICDEVLIIDKGRIKTSWLSGSKTDLKKYYLSVIQNTW